MDMSYKGLAQNQNSLCDMRPLDSTSNANWKKFKKNSDEDYLKPVYGGISQFFCVVHRFMTEICH
jgi:hypothetical protein